MSKGKFIVIDGTDGSGKKTQVDLLVNRLRKEGRKVKTIDFPQYSQNFFGEVIGRYLTGEFGKLSEVSPYLASVIYACDRFESKDKIEKWLSEGALVIGDRYASSNQIHQGGKTGDSKEREKFLAWLEKMEYGVFKIPRPDGVIYLDVPVEHSAKLLKNKDSLEKKKYLKGKKDILESDMKHQQDAKTSAIDIVKKSNNWVRVDCIKDGELMSREAVNNLVYGAVKEILDI